MLLELLGGGVGEGGGAGPPAARESEEGYLYYYYISKECKERSDGNNLQLAVSPVHLRLVLGDSEGFGVGVIRLGRGRQHRRRLRELRPCLEHLRVGLDILGELLGGEVAPVDALGLELRGDFSC